MSQSEICELLDKLTIDLLELVEQQVQCKLNLENNIVEGQLLMAKSRYIQGTQSVSFAQLPTENGQEFSALTTVSTVKTDLHTNQRELERHPIDRDNRLIDPLKWFGILVPQALQSSQKKFQASIDLICECANIQNNLMCTIKNIFMLKQMKKEVS